MHADSSVECVYGPLISSHSKTASIPARTGNILQIERFVITMPLTKGDQELSFSFYCSMVPGMSTASRL